MGRKRKKEREKKKKREGDGKQEKGEIRPISVSPASFLGYQVYVLSRFSFFFYFLSCYFKKNSTCFKEINRYPNTGISLKLLFSDDFPSKRCLPLSAYERTRRKRYSHTRQILAFSLASGFYVRIKSFSRSRQKRKREENKEVEKVYNFRGKEVAETKAPFCLIFLVSHPFLFFLSLSLSLSFFLFLSFSLSFFLPLFLFSFLRRHMSKRVGEKVNSRIVGEGGESEKERVNDPFLSFLLFHLFLSLPLTP